MGTLYFKHLVSHIFTFNHIIMNHQRTNILVGPVLLLVLAACGTVSPTTISPPSFELPDKHFPVTDKEPNNDPNIIRFAIMGDRTGGMLPGVFEIGVKKVNLMQPEFVISVGDLVDGYTEDPLVWNAQWEEFENIIAPLEMPFFFVPGNHDISNTLLKEEWERRHGAPYYHFVYNNVLFLALHTEDGPGVTGGISDEQAAYFVNVLQEYPDVRWTFVFKHRPLWHYGNKLGYEKIESALDDRNYTLFSGHHHHYFHTKHKGMKHYILGTTGGGSHLRGWEFGEFEHITWVTLKDDGPVVAHLELDGVHDENIVNEQNYTLVQALRMGNWMQIPPLLNTTNTFDVLDIEITFTNQVDDEMHISGNIEPMLGVRFEPSVVKKVITGNTSITKTVRMINESGATLHDLNESGIHISLKAGYDSHSGRLELSAARRLIFDWHQTLTNANTPIVIDGNLDDWEDFTFTTISNPVYMHEDWDWRGADDGTFKFSTAISEDHLYIAIEAFDDVLILPSRDSLSRHQDQFYINIDANTPETRTSLLPNRLYGTEMIPSKYHLQIRVAPGATVEETLVETNNSEVSVQAASILIEREKRFVTEVAIPLEYIASLQGLNWGNIRINIGWMDHDRPENTKPSILWWRPVWGKTEDFSGSATFYKE